MIFNILIKNGKIHFNISHKKGGLFKGPPM